MQRSTSKRCNGDIYKWTWRLEEYSFYLRTPQVASSYYFFISRCGRRQSKVVTVHVPRRHFLLDTSFVVASATALALQLVYYRIVKLRTHEGRAEQFDGITLLHQKASRNVHLDAIILLASMPASHERSWACNTCCRHLLLQNAPREERHGHQWLPFWLDCPHVLETLARIEKWHHSVTGTWKFAKSKPHWVLFAGRNNH